MKLCSNSCSLDFQGVLTTLCLTLSYNNYYCLHQIKQIIFK